MPALSRRTTIISSLALPLLSRFAHAADAATLMRGNRYEPATLDPHKVNTDYELGLVHDLFEGLATYDAEGHPVPGLAASWAASPDGKRYTFRLRPDLKWSDGAPLTAEDAVFSLRRLMDPKTAANKASLLYVLKNGRAVNTGAAPLDALGISTPDPLSVVIDLETPAPYLPEILAGAYAAFVPRHVIAKLGDGWVKPGAMVSSGAFTLQSWESQSRIVLARNPQFFDAANVKLARVVYVPTSDLTSGLARFKSGELDMQLDFPLAQVAALRAELPVETRLVPSLLTYYLALNTENPKLADARVRRALSMAIDRDVLTEKVLRAGEQPAFSFTPPGIAAYQPPRMDFAEKAGTERLKEAAELLAQAGYSESNPLKLTYGHSSSLDLRRIAVIIASMWRRIGIETAPLNTEGKVHFANMRQGNFEVAFAGWSADFNDASSFLSVLESARAHSNYSRYRSAVYDDLMAKAAAMENAGARADLLRRAEAQMLADQPIIPLYYGVTKSLVSQRVVGWRANSGGIHLSRYLSVIR